MDGEPSTFGNPLGLGYTITIETVHRWGLTWDQYHEMLAAQRGCCAICERHQSEVGALVVDHDHSKPGKAVRALLCQGCNRGLGHFRDDPQLLEAAARYLCERGCWITNPETAEEAQALAPHRVTPEQQARRTADVGRGYRLELTFLDGRRETALYRADERITDGGTFSAFGTQWRASGGTLISPRKKGGRTMASLICNELAD